ncbi:MAG TPA: biotin--[acetyl-CoA-carboxylase] ligase [Bryobacteraceae bacterium]|jgi:BirA family biotin operon repressor/biotin-[acetyl-CoA-carboxylase] ligase|nr:biotin--[acetyl-CoA-carboxylase] ligase [Bryobacteraceae bacterium]
MPLDIDKLLARRPQNKIYYFPTLGSTMAEATRLATSGAPHGTIVLADEQTQGVGRLGRAWQSQSEVGIYCSILLRLPLAPASLPVASLLLGLATVEAVQKSTQLACDLRWPNDVLINERKVAGILTHLVDACIVAGIGINVNQAVMPTGFRTPATSLRMESDGRVQSREEIVANLLESLDVFCSMLTTEGTPSILRIFSSASSYAINRRVIVEESGARGLTAGLDENGFLLVQSDAGRIERVATGGVRPDYQFGV